MTKRTQLTIPIGPLNAGTFGPFTSALLPADLSGYLFDFTKDATWPTTGGDVCKFTVEQSNDGGQTWQFDAALTFSPAVWRDRAGNPVDTAVWSVSLDNKGSATRKIRASVEVFRPCRLGALISSV